MAWLEVGLSGIRIHQNLVQEGVKVGYSRVKEFIARTKREQSIFIRIHTEPGEEAQVDFGYVGEFSTHPGHYPEYKCLSQTEYQEKYQAKMAAIGQFAEQIFFGMLHQYKNNWSRPVQGILALKKQFSSEIINLACQRAIAYNVYEYQVIKNICHNGSYTLPIELNS